MKTLKIGRVLSKIVIISLLIGLLPTYPFNALPQPVHGTTYTSLGIWSPSAQAEVLLNASSIAGSVIQFKVNVSSIQTPAVMLNGFDITVRWNSSILTGTSVTYVGGIFDLPEFSQLPGSGVGPGQARLAGFLLGTFVPANGTIMTFTVTVQAIGSTDIRIDETASFLTNPSTVPYESINGFFSNAVGTGDLGISSLTVPSETITLGDTFNMTVNLRNLGSSLMNDVVLSLYANSTVIYNATVGTILPGTVQQQIVTWNTVGFSPGLFNITAVVTTSSLDAFAENNRLSLERINLVVHDLEIESANSNSTSARFNTTGTRVTVVVANKGTIRDFANVSVYANSTIINTVVCGVNQCFDSATIPGFVEPGLTKTFTFDWNTSDVALGRYSLEARTVIVAGEANVTNNVRLVGLVTVKLNFEYDLVLRTVEFPNTPVIIGTNETLSYNVRNNGVFAESYVFGLYIDNVLRNQTTGVLARSVNVTILFTWKTILFSPALYIIKANVSLTGAADESLADNEVSRTASLGENKNSPQAYFDFAPLEPDQGTVVSFNATRSMDKDFDDGIHYFIWDFGDGTAGNGMITNHTYGSAGTYQVTLTVWDLFGKQNSTSQSLTVRVPIIFYIAIGAGVAAAAAVAAVIFVVMRKRRMTAKTPAQTAKLS